MEKHIDSQSVELLFDQPGKDPQVDEFADAVKSQTCLAHQIGPKDNCDYITIEVEGEKLPPEKAFIVVGIRDNDALHKGQRRRGMRSTAKCLNCGDPREIVSHALCAKCFMQRRRSEDKAGDPSWMAGPDRTQRREQRDLNKMGETFFKMLRMLSETSISNLVVTDSEFADVKTKIVTWIGRIHTMQKSPAIQTSKNGKGKLTVIPESELTVNKEPEA